LRQPPASLVPALARYRSGDLAGARAAVEAALAAEPNNVELSAFAGLVAAQAGDPAGALPHFRRVSSAAPDDISAQLNLATALLATGRLDEAGAVCAAGGNDPGLLRIAAYVHQQQGRLAEAAAAYEAAIKAAPGDWGSLNNLGNVRAAMGEADAAVDAFREAIALKPDMVEIVINLSDALGQAERIEERQAMMREAARISPQHARVQIQLGFAEADARDFAAAERAFRAAIRLDPGNISAYLELAVLLENLNRVDDLAGLVDQAEATAGGPETNFIRAWALRRQGRFAEALPLVEAVPDSIDPMRRAQLLAEIADRLGHAKRAFAAFTAMNRAAVAAKPAPPGPTYREAVAADAAMLTPEWIASWTKVDLESAPPAPVFIVGFPRSGTTLLDTLLMNLPALHVLEELPPVGEVQVMLGGQERLAALASDEANALRRRYFEALDILSPPGADQIVVDKYPLHMARIATIHRIFPDAKIVFVERHPCDVVLSCFMSNFALSRAMRSFTDLEETALLYDRVFDAWTRAATLLPLDVHRIRYEHMVEDVEGEMRGLLDYLGQPWDASVLDNQASAARRGHIGTASYAQVTEPVYQRSAGRWLRYRDELAPVLPILAPWAERLGYTM
jgi:tetratricopeptide (TPR) repeat protein